MSTAEKEAALVALAEARSQLDALTARVLAASDDVGEQHGLRDAAAWLALATRTTRREARRDLALGRMMETHPDVASALSSGALRTEQARVVAEAVDALPVHVDEETRWRAETTLLAHARDHDAGDLKQIGKRILDVVAPEVGECHEASVLAAEEARADAGAVVLVDDGAGRCHGRFEVPSHVGKMLKRHLLALANPARHTEDELTDDTGAWKPLRWRLGEAFVEYVGALPGGPHPADGGSERHRRGDDDAGAAPRGRQHRAARRRCTDVRGPGSSTGVRGRDHPCGPRLTVLAARPGPPDSALHEGAAHRSRAPGRRLHRGGL